jgi:adenylate kinase family enzyme
MKVAVFGKPGGGKSTVARQIATVAHLPLQPLDLIQYRTGGEKLADEEFLERHAEVLAQPRWVIDGFGTPVAFEATLRAADVLVYIDRAILVHYWWVTKRLLMSPFAKPLGWPDDSPLLASTITSYRFLRLSRRFWTPALEARLLAMPGKRVFVIRRQSDVASLLDELGSSAVRGVA